MSTYEGVRHTLDINGIKDLRIKALVGGSCASLGEQNLTLHCLLFLRGFGPTFTWLFVEVWPEINVYFYHIGSCHNVTILLLYTIFLATL